MQRFHSTIGIHEFRAFRPLKKGSTILVGAGVHQANVLVVDEILVRIQMLQEERGMLEGVPLSDLLASASSALGDSASPEDAYQFLGEILWVQPHLEAKASDGFYKNLSDVATGYSWYDWIIFCNLWTRLEWGLTRTANCPPYRIEFKIDQNRSGLFDTEIKSVVDGGGEGFILPSKAQWKAACLNGEDKMPADTIHSKPRIVALGTPNKKGLYDTRTGRYEVCSTTIK